MTPHPPTARTPPTTPQPRARPASATPPLAHQASEDEVIAFLAGRPYPCPRCTYDLRDIQTARCPECGEPLVLKIGTPRARFGWLILAIAPGCFSGVASCFVLIPIIATIIRGMPGQQAPWPVIVGDLFGFCSAASVGFMYYHRHRIMSWRPRTQAAFAAGVWAVHILMFVLIVLALWLLS